MKAATEAVKQHGIGQTLSWTNEEFDEGVKNAAAVHNLLQKMLATARRHVK